MTDNRLSVSFTIFPMFDSGESSLALSKKGMLQKASPFSPLCITATGLPVGVPFRKSLRLFQN